MDETRTLSRAERAAQVCALLAREFPEINESRLELLRRWGEAHFSSGARQLNTLCLWTASLEATGLNLEVFHDTLTSRYGPSYRFDELLLAPQAELFEEDRNG